MSSPTLIPFRKNSDNEAAILYIHGFTAETTETWGSFPAFLLGHPPLEGWDAYAVGYSTSLVPDFLRGIGRAHADLATLATMLRTKLNTPPLEQYRQFALVAHSMGGLLAQKALLELTSVHRCHSLFMFGTPSSGLRKAWLVRFLKRQIQDMSPGSQFMTTLRDDWEQNFGKTPPFNLVAAAGDEDDFVPRSSSLDPFPEKFRAVVPGDHPGIVKPLRPTHTSVQLLIHTLTRNALPTGPLSSARLAVEQGEFRKAVRKFRYQQCDDLDESARVQYALALDRMGDREEAISLLRDYDISDTDAMGTLAGRLKRRWKKEHNKADADEALALYQQAYEQIVEENHAQAFYHAINVAFFQRLYNENLDEAERWVEKALRHCEQDENINPEPNVWRAATRGEAYLQLGKLDDANSWYGRAVSYRPEPRQVLSMIEQAMEIAEALYDKSVQDRLLDVFQGR